MRAARLESASDFSEGIARMKDVLEHILGYDEIKALIGKSLVLQVFAAEAFVNRTGRRIREIMGWHIIAAFAPEFFGGWAARRGFVNSEVSPIRKLLA